MTINDWKEVYIPDTPNGDKVTAYALQISEDVIILYCNGAVTTSSDLVISDQTREDGKYELVSAYNHEMMDLLHSGFNMEPLPDPNNEDREECDHEHCHCHEKQQSNDKDGDIFPFPAEAAKDDVDLAEIIKSELSNHELPREPKEIIEPSRPEVKEEEDNSSDNFRMGNKLPEGKSPMTFKGLEGLGAIRDKLDVKEEKKQEMKTLQVPKEKKENKVEQAPKKPENKGNYSNFRQGKNEGKPTQKPNNVKTNKYEKASTESPIKPKKNPDFSTTKTTGRKFYTSNGMWD